MWTEKKCVKYEAKPVSNQGLINLVKAQMRICVYADFQRLPLSDCKEIWCKSNVICCIVNVNYPFSDHVNSLINEDCY